MTEGRYENDKRNENDNKRKFCISREGSKMNQENQTENTASNSENYPAKIDQLASEYLICSWCQQESLDKIAQDKKLDRIAYDDLTIEEQCNVLEQSVARNQKRYNPEGRKDLSHGICQKHLDEVQIQIAKDAAEMGL